jgi:hypothetical protein
MYPKTGKFMYFLVGYVPGNVPGGECDVDCYIIVIVGEHCRGNFNEYIGTWYMAMILLFAYIWHVPHRCVRGQ